MLPQSFKLSRYQLTLEALDELRLPPFKSSALRGGFGHTFKRLACMQPQRCDQNCQRENACAYGYVFETAPPKNSEVLRNFSEVPRPFVIIPPDDRRNRVNAGERLTFGLTLIGQGIKQLPYFIVVFRELGQIGLGHNRGKYRLLNVTAIAPYNNTKMPIYNAGDDTLHSADLALDGPAITTRAAGLAPDRLTLTFLTPTRLKHKGKWVWAGPPFEILVKALLGRTSSLSYFHCGQRLEVDFRGLIDRAAAIQIVDSDTRWQDWSRISGRQKQHIKLGGLMGRVTYKGDLQPYLPLLALGEFIHIGKGTVFGNGQYKIGMFQMV